MGVTTGWHTYILVSSPDPTDAAADGLHHRYASVGGKLATNSWPTRKEFHPANHIAAMH